MSSPCAYTGLPAQFRSEAAAGWLGAIVLSVDVSDSSRRCAKRASIASADSRRGFARLAMLGPCAAGSATRASYRSDCGNFEARLAIHDDVGRASSSKSAAAARSRPSAICGAAGSFGLAGLASATTGAFFICARYCLASPWKRARVLAADRGAHGELLRQRIDRLAAAIELVVQVRAGRHAGRADEADHLALAHRDAGLDARSEPRHVRRSRCRRRWCAATSRRCRSRRWSPPSRPCRCRPPGSACRVGAPKSTPACSALKPRIGCSRMPKREVILEASIGVRRKERTTLSPWGL